MGSTIRARFSHGTLKPLEAVELREGDEVTITIVSSRAESGGDWLDRTAGGWAGLVDTEELKREIYDSRLIFLIDTDWVIDHFNGVTQVTRRLKELQPQGLGLSVVSAAELWEGAYFSRDPKRSQETLEGFSRAWTSLVSMRKSANGSDSFVGPCVNADRK